MVRIPSADAVLIKQYLDIGVRSLMVPMVETAEMATAARNLLQAMGIAVEKAGFDPRWN